MSRWMHGYVGMGGVSPPTPQLDRRQLLSWEIEIVGALAALGKVSWVDDYFEKRGVGWRQDEPSWSEARARWHESQTVERPGADVDSWLRDHMHEMQDTAAVWLRDSVEFHGSERRPVWDNWARAAAAVPGQPDVWFVLAQHLRGGAPESAVAFALAEAICCARGEPAAVRLARRFLSLTTSEELSNYFVAAGHQPVGEWIRLAS